MPKLCKSSKYFTALAKGLFVLHPDFVFHSLNKKRFLDPEEYEIGSDKCKIKIKMDSPELVRAPYICRQTMLRNPDKYQNGLFSNMNFIILAKPDKREIYKNIIKSGGGSVESESLPLKASALKQKTINYCLFEMQDMLSNKDRETLGAFKITIKNVRYIYDLLLSEDK
jgi:hypothetical protein